MWVNCFDTFVLLDFTFSIFSCRPKQSRRLSPPNRNCRGQGRGPPTWVNCFETSVLLDFTFSIFSCRPKQSLGSPPPTATAGGRAEAHQCEWIVLIPLCYLILHSPSSHAVRNSRAGPHHPTATAGGRAEAHQREWIVLIPLCYLILHSPSSHAVRTVAHALTIQPLQQGAGQRPTNVSELFWYLCVTWFYI